jgi:hypothetical protein
MIRWSVDRSVSVRARKGVFCCRAIESHLAARPTRGEVTLTESHPPWQLTH